MWLLLWAVPAVLAGAGALALVILLRGARDEARELGREIARFGELHASLVRVRAEIQRSR